MQAEQMLEIHFTLLGHPYQDPALVTATARDILQWESEPMQEQADPTWDPGAVNASCREVGEWLDLRMKTGRCSMGFVRELAIHK